MKENDQKHEKMMDMEMGSHGSVSIMKRRSQHKTTGQSLWRAVSFIRTRWLNKLRLRAPHKSGRAGGPDSTYRDHWWLQLGKNAFLTRDPCTGGHADLLYIAQRKKNLELCVSADDDDDDETFRKSPAAQSESLDNGNTNWYERTPRLTLGAYLSKQLFTNVGISSPDPAG